jgi:hypothetical protein
MAVQFAISDFGFAMQESSNFKMPPGHDSLARLTGFVDRSPLAHRSVKEAAHNR